MCDYDPEVLIEEVRKRPALWDPADGDYVIKELKERYWQEITEVFNTNEKASKYERIELCRQLKRKWKSLRDCFSRELSKRRKSRRSGSGGAGKRFSTYIYYKPMSFLLTAGRRERDSRSPAAADADADEDDDEPLTRSVNPLKVEVESVEDACSPLDDHDNDDDSDDDPPTRPPPPPPPPTAITAQLKKRKKPLRRPSSGGSSQPSQPPKPKVARTEEAETGRGRSERMFLLSLLGPLLQVPAHMRLAVQMDMMSVIQNAISARNPEFVMAEARIEYDDE